MSGQPHALIGRIKIELQREIMKLGNFACLPRSLLAVTVFGLLVSQAAVAGPANKVYRPIVEKGETEIEFRGGYRTFDGGPDEYATVLDLGYAFTNRWKSELVLEYADEEGLGGRLEAAEWENLIVLTEQGKHWVDVGLLIEYEHSFADGPDELKIGPLFEKEIGPTIADLNLIFAHEVGRDASDETELDYAWQVKWRGNEALEFGLQGIGGFGTLSNFGEEDSHSIGPALFGVQRLKNGNKLGYDAAILAGVNEAAPDLTFRFQLEYEIY
jgi:hypothetical protein